MLKKAFQILTETSSSSTDSYISYSQHIANELRKYDQRTLIYAKNVTPNLWTDTLQQYSTPNREKSMLIVRADFGEII